MWEDIIRRVQEAVEADVVGRFGLSEEQAKETGNIVTDNLSKLFSEDLLQKDFDIQSLVKDFNDPEKNPILQRFNTRLLPDLIEKAGLPPDVAEKIKDFSGQELLNKLKEAFLDENGKPDFRKIMQHMDMKQMQELAATMFGRFGSMFGSKQK